MSRTLCVAASVLLLAFANQAAAQEVTDSLRWTRVRVTAWDSSRDRTVTVGILSRLTADSLVLARGKRTTSIARDRVLLVEASDGGNGLTGAVAGFLVGAAVGTLAWTKYSDVHSLDDSENLYFGLLFGVPTGGFLGASIGGALTRERWTPVSLTRSGNGRWSVSLRLRAPRPRRDLTFPSG